MKKMSIMSLSLKHIIWIAWHFTYSHILIVCFKILDEFTQEDVQLSWLSDNPVMDHVQSTKTVSLKKSETVASYVIDSGALVYKSFHSKVIH
jgi:hypothetical protein